MILELIKDGFRRLKNRNSRNVKTADKVKEVDMDSLEIEEIKRDMEN